MAVEGYVCIIMESEKLLCWLNYKLCFFLGATAATAIGKPVGKPGDKVGGTEHIEPTEIKKK